MATNGEGNWEGMFLEQEKSGQTVSVFCNTREINYHSFKNRKTHWNKRRRGNEGVAADFIEVIGENKAIVKVGLRNGRSLEVPSNFQEATVRRLIEILESC